MTIQLPIEKIKPLFETEVQKRHLVIESPTGSGKSTLLPIWASRFGRVLVVEPRRIACRALGGYVAHLCASQPGQAVGYATRFQHQYSDQSGIVFVTPGIALSWFAQNKLAAFQLVILDEFHERRWDTDLLVALLKQRNRHRLVITSATVEGDRLAQYLGGKRLEAEGRSYPVTKSYRGSTDTVPPSLRELVQRTLEAVQFALKQVDNGDLLVFLPGKGEITACLQSMQVQLNTEVLPLHADIAPHEQDIALQPGQKRRVILATNVAETSLTIPGVSTVIDSGLERRTHYRNGRTVLGLHAISRASADQRAGRAGRLGPGHCIRLWGSKSPLESFTPPQILREELTELVMATARAGIAIDSLKFPDTPPIHAIDRAKERLSKMKALGDDACLTEYGKRLAPLPLDPLFAHLVTAMPDNETRADMIDLAASLTMGRSPLIPPRTEAQIRALAKWVPEACDMTTRIQLIRQQPPEELQVRGDILEETRRISTEIRRALNLPSIKNSPSIHRNELLKATLVAAPELVFVRRVKRTNALGNGCDEVEVGKESRFLDKELAAIVFDQHSLPGSGRKQTISFATCMAPIPLKSLIENNLCQSSYQTPRWEGRKIITEQQMIYAGRTIQRRDATPSGDFIRQAASQLILRGKIIPRVGPQILLDIEAWNLYNHLNCPSQPILEGQQWLTDKLESLGVDHSEDLQLIEAGDVRFDGIPVWERKEFDSQYPRELQLEKMRVQVHYDTQKKRITVERCSGTRKTPPRSLELPNWHGWRVYFKDASREMLIK